MFPQKSTEKKRKIPEWKNKKPPYQCGRDGFSIAQVERDEEGWADVDRFLPINYEMVQLFIEGKNNLNGWWNGYTWEGFRLRDGDRVLYWRYKDEREKATKKSKKSHA